MEEIVASTCQGCLTNCSIRVRTRGADVVAVEGNPASAATQGVVCQNVRIAMEQRTDPDRVLYPLRRRNPRKGRLEDPRFERISWDEALDEIADRLMGLRARGESHRVAVAKGRSTNLGSLLNSAFPKIYGTPNSINHDSICDQGEKVALSMLDGVDDYRDLDYDQVEYVLMWGMDPLASNRWKSRFRQMLPALSKQARLVEIDPRLSLTGKAAHEWHAIVPGTDAALALALAHVILAEGLWNRSFVGDFADGRNRFAPGQMVDGSSYREHGTQGLVKWWNEELRYRTPEWSERLCGIAAQDIRRIARDFSAAGPRAVSWTSPGLAMVARGFYGCMAAHALNGLVGSAGPEGAVVTYAPAAKGKLPDASAFQDEVARAACAHERIDQRGKVGFASISAGKAGAGQNCNRIPEAHATGDPYKLDTLIGCWCNFAYSAPGAQRWEEFLASLPFYVDITTHISESAHFADIVLPARHHAFETWGVVNSRQGGRTCVTVSQPCVPAPGEARGDETDVPFLLAEKLAERGFPNLLEYYRSIYDPVSGLAPQSGDELAEYAAKTLTYPCWNNQAESGDGAEVWEAFRAHGVWNGPSARKGACDSDGRFATPSGVFEFESGKLRSLLDDYATSHGLTVDQAMATLRYDARGALAVLPHWEEPVRIGDAEEFPLVFTQHRAHASLEGRAANTQLFQKLKGTDPGDVAYDDVVKLHPDDMRKLGLTDGDDVSVVSPQGKIACHVRAWEGTRPGVAVKCYGQGHWAYGAVARGIGGNNNEVVPAVWERITSSSVRHGGVTRVRVEKR